MYKSISLKKINKNNKYKGTIFFFPHLVNRIPYKPKNVFPERSNYIVIYNINIDIMQLFYNENKYFSVNVTYLEKLLDTYIYKEPRHIYILFA